MPLIDCISKNRLEGVCGINSISHKSGATLVEEATKRHISIRFIKPVSNHALSLHLHWGRSGFNVAQALLSASKHTSSPSTELHHRIKWSRNKSGA